MTKLKMPAYIAGFSLLALCFSIASCRNGSSRKTAGYNDSMVLLTIKPIQLQNGWGYEIFAGNKLFIKQDKVPQITGTHYFLSREDAKKAAKLVIEKLKNNELPSIDTLELQKAGARYN
ncbi:DUF4907 domain-containing protein [Arachidicoccus ginsenosidimutans]|uniref:DUF4907 domain-containing protein n=1 Tax=Arachidicoccus sp. BS20 TaxID=1850526 RepID=UPI0018D301A1|nr:DUF4907 domain-containing protein [Arachidicoccus sp. BS20]